MDRTDLSDIICPGLYNGNKQGMTGGDSSSAATCVKQKAASVRETAFHLTGILIFDQIPKQSVCFISRALQ